MKKKENINTAIKINQSLKQYKNKILFPEKLAKANEMLEKVGLPKKISSVK
jgi:hypothetical protein